MKSKISVQHVSKFVRNSITTLAHQNGWKVRSKNSSGVTFVPSYFLLCYHTGFWYSTEFGSLLIREWYVQCTPQRTLSKRIQSGKNSDIANHIIQSWPRNDWNYWNWIMCQIANVLHIQISSNLFLNPYSHGFLDKYRLFRGRKRTH